jgi:hypothetical protein
MQNCDTEHRNSGWCRRSHCALRAQPPGATSGAALAYVGADASSASPGEARRERFERDSSPETLKVKPPNRIRFAPSPSQKAAITSFPSPYGMKVLCK